jgi:hypothetical protein
VIIGLNPSVFLILFQIFTSRIDVDQPLQCAARCVGQYVAEWSEQMIAVRLPTVSFGAVSAIVTSVGLIVGFGAAGISKATVVAGLLIVGIADNLTDSLSIHVYQESERLEEHAAFRATLGNFMTRLVISLSFVALVLQSSNDNTVWLALLWGGSLLIGLTWIVAKRRGTNVTVEVLKHLAVATVVIVVSRVIGTFISTHIV